MMIPQLEKDVAKTPFGQSVSQQPSVHFKGRPGSLELLLDEDAPLLTILAELKQLLEQNKQLLGDVAFTLNFGDRPVDGLQLGEVRRVIERQGMRVKQLQATPASIEAYLEGEFGLPFKLATPQATPEARVTNGSAPPVPEQAEPALHPPSEPPLHAAPQVEVATQPRPARPTRPLTPAQQPPARQQEAQMPSFLREAAPTQNQKPAPLPARLPEFDTQPESAASQHTRPGIVALGEAESNTRTLHKVLRTCRAGTFIDVEGDVVLFGDLNPGAEIRATGDILVFGSLRGIAHAGSQGDNKAIIAAYDMSPTQLRLAGQIAIAPADEKRRRSKTTIEVAYLGTQRQIEVETCIGGKFPHELRELSL